MKITKFVRRDKETAKPISTTYSVRIPNMVLKKSGLTENDTIVAVARAGTIVIMKLE